MIRYLCRKKMLDYKRERITPEDIGFIDPNVVHEVNIQKKPEEVKQALLRCFKRYHNKKKYFFLTTSSKCY